MKVKIEFEVTDAFRERCLEHRLTPQMIAEEAIYYYQSKEPSMVTEMAVEPSWSNTTTHLKMK